MNAKFLRVESEHSAMAALIGAQSAGVRTFTATSSQGLALMHELLHWASGARLPIVMAEVNRALAPGWNIWIDQTDSLAQRDTGWIQLYCEDGQEVLDTTLQAFRLAETVNLPVMVVLDAFFLSHTYEPVDVPDQEEVGPLPAALRAAVSSWTRTIPAPSAPWSPPNVYMEMRYEHRRWPWRTALAHFDEIEDGVRRSIFGRRYGAVEAIDCEMPRSSSSPPERSTSTARLVLRRARGPGRKGRASSRSSSSGPSPSTRSGRPSGGEEGRRHRPEFLLRGQRHLRPGGPGGPLQRAGPRRPSSATLPGSAAGM